MGMHLSLGVWKHLVLKTRSRFLAWPILAVALVGCGGLDLGEAQVGVSLRSLSAGDVDRVTVTVSGQDIAPPIVHDLVRAGGQWKGVIGQIPVGTNRTFHADAYDASATAIYSGEVTGVTITKGAPAVVVLLLQQATPPTPFVNSVPVIDGLVASAAAVGPEEEVSLALSAHDPDPGDALAYSWTATGGTFSSTSSASVVWTAPAVAGSYNLMAAIQDQKGATNALALTVEVQPHFAKGKAKVSVSFNTWPEVSGLTAQPGMIAPGATAAIQLVAVDGDGDLLAFSWSDNCGGSFSSTTAEDPVWTAPLGPPLSCTLSVAISDGRGGATTGSLTVLVGSVAPNIAPQIDSSYQSAEDAVAGETVTFRVYASDPEGGVLSFAWSAASGSLGTAQSTSTSSEVVWTASGICPTAIVLTATDPEGAQTAYTFNVDCRVLMKDTYTRPDSIDLGSAEVPNVPWLKTIPSGVPQSLSILGNALRATWPSNPGGVASVELGAPAPLASGLRFRARIRRNGEQSLDLSYNCTPGAWISGGGAGLGFGFRWNNLPPYNSGEFCYVINGTVQASCTPIASTKTNVWHYVQVDLLAGGMARLEVAENTWPGEPGAVLVGTHLDNLGSPSTSGTSVCIRAGDSTNGGTADVDDVSLAFASQPDCGWSTDTSTVGHWCFTGNANDLGPNALHGTIQGATPVTGVYGEALDFNGTSAYVRVPSSSTLFPTTALTVEARVYARSASGDQFIWDIQNAYGLGISNGGKVVFFGRVNGVVLAAISSAVVPTNRWSTLAGTYDGSKLRVFIDGALAGETPASGSLTRAYQCESPSIGSWCLANGGWFDGIVDEVRVSNAVRY